MSASIRARRDARGFSFVELLVTIVIVSIAFAAMVPLFVQALEVSSGDKMRAVALNLAQDRIEKLRQVDFELITPANLADNSFYFGEFGSSWTEQTEAGQKDFVVDYSVSEPDVSATDSRTAYKVVTVTVDWVGPPEPHKTAVLTTMIYRQDGGPELVGFTIDPKGSTWAGNPKDEQGITGEVTLKATVNAADLNSMKLASVGVPPHDVLGRVDFLVTSSTGAASTTISVPADHNALTNPTPAVFQTSWSAPLPTGALVGAADGLYTFKAVAFTAMSSPGNSWELTYRVETGAPAAVTNLQGTAGLTSASLTWNASITGDIRDVEGYRVKRADGTVVASMPKASGSMGYTDKYDAPVLPNTHVVYTVEAIDWKGNVRAATANLVAINTAALAPNPATLLTGEAFGSTARLTWTASTTPLVLGYNVYQTIGGTTTIHPTAIATLDVAQGWNTTALYQVKPYVAGGIESLSWATLGTLKLGQFNNGGWLQMATGPETKYTLIITNTANQTLPTLRLYYLGEAGASTQQEVTPSGTNVAKNATHSWTLLPYGKYRWDWPGPGNSGTNSRTGWCTGTVLTITGTTQ